MHNILHLTLPTMHTYTSHLHHQNITKSALHLYQTCIPPSHSFQTTPAPKSPQKQPRFHIPSVKEKLQILTTTIHHPSRHMQAQHLCHHRSPFFSLSNNHSQATAPPPSPPLPPNYTSTVPNALSKQYLFHSPTASPPCHAPSLQITPLNITNLLFSHEPSTPTTAIIDHKTALLYL